MCLLMDDGGPLRRVSPFRHLRISGYLLLPAAFRSLSRLSSALSAKASTLRPFCLTFLICVASHIRALLDRFALDRAAFPALSLASRCFLLRFAQLSPRVPLMSCFFCFRYAVFKVRCPFGPDSLFFPVLWRRRDSNS